MTVSRVPNVEGGIQPTIVTAKGDLITAVANANPARLGVGSDGQLLTADSTSATGLSYQNNFAAGKNKIINGDFSVWQRGSSFTCNGSTTYTADRTANYYDGTGATVTVSRQTFTPGTSPVAGYEAQYFYRFAQTVAGSGGTYAAFYYQPVEDVRTLAGQTVTLSFWAKADAARLYYVYINQFFGTGGSAEVVNSTTITSTTGWVRYSYTVALASLSGKTIGTNSLLSIRIEPGVRNITQTLDIWGVQLEAGPVATAFQTATGTIQGELAACQRYYVRFSSSDSFAPYAMGSASQTNTTDFPMNLPVTLRVPPTAIDYSNIGTSDGANAILTGGTFAIPSATNGNDKFLVRYSKTGATQFRPYYIINNAGAGYIGFSAEL